MIYSKQREVIADALNSTRAHPTADELYQEIKPACPNLSLATVYRNLNQLVQSGAAIKINVPGGADRFDGTTVAHHHMVCEGCGRVIDIPDGTITISGEEILNASGCRVNHFDVMLYGLCAECNDNNKNSNKK